MRAGVLVSCCILVWISSIEAAQWSEWKDLTICNAKPCRCMSWDRRSRCEKGEKMQVRFCIREDGDTDSCKRDIRGVMRMNKCTNKGVCPGWSEWQSGKCDCMENMRIDKRYCDNPPPIHPDVLCETYLGEPALEEEIFDLCSCTEDENREKTQATTTTTMEPTSPLPCCVEDSYNYGTSDDIGDDVDDDVGFGGGSAAATTTKKPSAVDVFYYDMYDTFIGEQPTCRPCGSSTESDIDDYGGYGDYYG